MAIGAAAAAKGAVKVNGLAQNIINGFLRATLFRKKRIVRGEFRREIMRARPRAPELTIKRLIHPPAATLFLPYSA